KEGGYEVRVEGDPERALAAAQAEPFDLILCDVRMPGMDGREFLRRYKGAGGAALVVMMSAHGNEELAVAAMRDGAYDYLHKPFRPDEVLLTLRKAEEREGLRREVAALRASLETGGAGLVAESPAMRQVLDLATRAAARATTVLLTGESGTGKEVVARYLHRRGPRAAERFVAVNCAAIPEALLESELFGHRRGAFTGATEDRRGLFEEARRGTLLLDEIAELPLALQPKLLRVIEEGAIRAVGSPEERPVDVQLIAATAQPLDERIREGRFREDLYYRLNVVSIHLPPLRERPEDIPALAAHFVAQAGARQGRSLRLTPAALSRLEGWHWPGNVRELRNAVERAAVLSTTGILEEGDFPLGDPRHPGAGGGGAARLKPQVDALERVVIEAALAKAGGNRRAAARALGVSLRTLFYKLQRYKIDQT
ncbi:MAG TPA: sigma-54 dependent transcriptional regulator, partial [Gemmatimonadales bacterium]|nr:sigma-54 dependent transcriptional regulator [Gemmatimonadales bacterium]